MQGLHKEFVNIKIPKKKPKRKELTKQEKQLNREKSSVRVKCEHTISGVKRYNAIKALYRNHIKDLDVSLRDMKRGAWRQPYRFMLTSLGIWNFYLMAV
ncbi:MAG: transposase [Okeania sp. SIO2F4]|uniref:transposase family protein n=1 Tax=Okeania sp. SIO2F4 TaxID=2607790 RepID=UPI00142C43DD|nr:transposase [Okeania sp. SIO2F4]